MVHRINNRNPGYSDFSHITNAQNSNFSSTSNTPISEGATALKLENEAQEEQLNISEHNIISNQINDNLVENESKEEVLHLKEEAETNSEIESSDDSNGLENFHIEEETPHLFNSDESSTSTENEFDSFTKSESKDEDDDLEIPAFLRRQKN